MKKGIGLCVAGIFLLTITMHVSAQTDDPVYSYSYFGFAERCEDESLELTQQENIVCYDQNLRAQEYKMLDLVDTVRAETKGVDGETGKATDPMGKQQNQWRNALARKCSNLACLTTAYAARIAAIEKEWAEALQ